MRFRNSTTRYGIIAQTLHWLVALLVFVQFGLGIHVDGLPIGMARLQWLARHKSIGAMLLVLVLLRLGWRLLDPPPPLPSTMPRHQRRLARGTHVLLYALLIVAPLAGWLHASAAGFGVNVFGLFTLPDPVSRDPRLARIFHDLHAGLVFTLAVLVFIHVAAAVRHGFARDGVLWRMLPEKSR